ncbi:MAG: hypothetical protein ABSD74_06130 [Rhizomicrobium sp.]|jgi:hypothetical protein
MDRRVFVLAALLLCGCGSHPPLDAGIAGDLADGQIAPGKARIYVFAGGWYAAGDSSVGYPQGFVVSVDGVTVARVGPGEAVAVDVPHGHHIVSRNLITVWGVSADAVTADLGGVADGERVYIGVDRIGPGNGKTDRAPPGVRLFNDALAGTLGDATNTSFVPHQEPGEYLDFRDDGPEILKDRTYVVPDPAALAKLNASK